jgi:hypothetical protein
LRQHLLVELQRVDTVAVVAQDRGRGELLRDLLHLGLRHRSGDRLTGQAGVQRVIHQDHRADKNEQGGGHDPDLAPRAEVTAGLGFGR